MQDLLDRVRTAHRDCAAHPGLGEATSALARAVVLLEKAVAPPEPFLYEGQVFY